MAAAHAGQFASHSSARLLPRRAGSCAHPTPACRSCNAITGAQLRALPGLRAVADEAAAVMERDEVDDWEKQYGSGPLQYGISAQQGPRETMEDYVKVIQKGRCGFLYAGVFDGHQGPGAASYLSNRLYEAISDIIQKAADKDSGGAAGKIGRAALTMLPGGESEEAEDVLFCPVELQQILETTFEDMDREVLQHLQGQEVKADRLAGSTATVLLARRDMLVVANVGDSRAVLGRSGKAIHLSSEHRVTGPGQIAQSEIERVEAVGAWVADGRVCDILAVSRAFGDMEFKGEGLQQMMTTGVENEWWDQEFADSVHFTGSPVIPTPDVTELDANEEDEFIILATDGLWDVTSSHEAVTFARKSFRQGRSAQEVADALTTSAIRKHTCDNVSVVVVDLGGGKEGWPRPGQKKKASGWFSKLTGGR